MGDRRGRCERHDAERRRTHERPISVRRRLRADADVTNRSPKRRRRALTADVVERLRLADNDGPTRVAERLVTKTRRFSPSIARAYAGRIYRLQRETGGKCAKRRLLARPPRRLYVRRDETSIRLSLN